MPEENHDCPPLGQAVRERREELGVTQEKFADRAGLATKRVWQIENQEAAARFRIPLGTLNYHVRRLHALGFINLVRRVPRRGAVENFYSLKPGVQAEETFRTMGRELLSAEPDADARAGVLLDAPAIAALRPSVARLLREMRELEAATVRRTALRGDGSSFTVDVRFVVDGSEQRVVPIAS